MKNFTPLPLLVSFLFLPVYGQLGEMEPDHIKNLKAHYDLPAPGELAWEREPVRLKSLPATNLPLFMVSGQWEYTLMHGGYFTLGTREGMDEGIIDDYCQVTFGHPYAVSSFAYPVVDGKAYGPSDFQINQSASLRISGDTIQHQQMLGGIQATTRIYTNQDDDLIYTYRLINTDNVDHIVGAGLLFDVALGRWGDGYVRLIDSMVHHAQNIPLINNEIWLRERDRPPEGIGVILEFYDFTTPDGVKIGNWHDEFAGRESTGRIYDLALHANWNTLVLSPGDTLLNGFAMVSSPPDHLDESFLRWNLPQSFTLENNMLFPRQLETHVEIVNDHMRYNNLTLKIPETDFTFPWESPTTFTNIEDTGRVYQTARVLIPEIYDTTLIPVTLQLWNGNEIVDELERWVFIPATVFSNEGLDVHIDTAFSNYGKVNLSFKVQKTETGQLVNRLHKSNVFLYTNDDKVGDFDMMRDTTGGLNNTDIVFVLDVTGSMGNEIAAVRENIIEFADSLSYRGIDYRLGMVTFLDIIENVYDFTEDVQEFQMHVSEQYAHGGGDRAENSLDALATACQLNFRDDAVRIFIWITDADFHINNHITQETKESVINQLLAKGAQVFCIADPRFQTDFYDQIVMSTGGSFYDINGNFRDILLDVTRLHQSTNYLLSFVPDAPPGASDEIKVEVHYGGLGGADSILFSFVTQPQKSQKSEVEVLPNPVTSETRLQVTLPEPCDLFISIYDIEGRSLATRLVRGAPGNFELRFSEIIEIEKLQANKIYLLQVRMLSPPGEIHTYKIITSANH